MANVLIINEKPSVSMEFARTLGVKQTEKHNGYIEGYSDFFGCTIWITWCIGHLVTLAYPEKYDEKYKNWNMDDLPFLPENYLYEVIPSVQDQFNIVQRLTNTVGTSDKDKKELSTLSDDKKFLVPIGAQVNGGLENMINWDGKDKDLLTLIKYIADEDKLEKVLENPQVIKNPVVRNGKQSTIGYQPDVWKKWE